MDAEASPDDEEQRMSDRPDETPVEYQDSTQDQGERSADEVGAGGLVPTTGGPGSRPPSTGGPDAPPVVHGRGGGVEPGQDGPADGPRRGEGNLVQVPEGAALGQEEPPTDEERERLARFAGAAHHEMHGEGHGEQRPTDG